MAALEGRYDYLHEVAFDYAFMLWADGAGGVTERFVLRLCGPMFARGFAVRE